MSFTPTTTQTRAPIAQGGTSALHDELGVIRRLLPYLWEYRGRVILALAFLVTAKLANIAVPIVMKAIVDGLSPAHAVLAVPFALLAAYGALRLSSTLFNELRDIVFVKVAQRALRRVVHNEIGSVLTIEAIVDETDNMRMLQARDDFCFLLKLFLVVLVQLCVQKFDGSLHVYTDMLA